MFESLKKKISSWLGKEKEEKPKAGGKVKKDKSKKEVKRKEKIVKQQEKEIEPPLKFNAGTQKFEPDLEQLKEKAEQAEEAREIKEKPSFFAKLIKKISTSTLTQEQFDELFPELEMILLENNVALEIVDKIKESLSKDLVGIEVKKGEAEKIILQSLKDSILNLLIEPPDLLEQINKKINGPYTIIFFGINGSGKTTSIAKLAYKLKKHNISCLLAAGDTFRAASIEQLEKHASNLKIPIVKHDYGSDPAAIAFDAKKYAEKNKIKVVLIDTAGRMYTKANLIKEMEKIIRVSQPDLKIFVGESITGNDAVEQARTFNEAIGIDGIILSKADIDEKAGTILSVSYITKKPIYFLGTGQEYSDLTPFTKKTVLKNIGLE